MNDSYTQTADGVTIKGNNRIIHKAVIEATFSWGWLADLLESSKIQVMLAHPASAGHGLNLQAGGSIIVWFGQTWSLELYQQFNARLYRQGQQNHVVINHLILQDPQTSCNNQVVFLQVYHR